MSFRAEPAWRHGSAPRCAVLLVNLGTPDAATPAALRRYLAEFLSDPRVVEIPRLLWWPILHGIILRTRPAKSAAKYTSVWLPEGSPLAVWTARQAGLLAAALGERGHVVDVRWAMRYGRPAVASALDALRADGATRILVLPLYPQYAAATTASVADAVMQWAAGARRLPELRFVNEYHDDAGYIGALAASVTEHWRTRGRGQRLLLSFHGLPQRSLVLGDPYHCQCQKTARLLAEKLALAPAEVLVTFQSRFGKAKWLQPYTEPTLQRLAAEGVKRVDVMCPGFVADCLETLEEIDQEARTAFLSAGGATFCYIPCLNDHPAWIDALATLAERHLQGWDTMLAPDPVALDARRARALALGAPD
jgi:protoporphyrin/coproporphyrin ferrochelatase